MKVVIGFLTGLVRSPGLALWFSAVSGYGQKCAHLSRLWDCCCWKQRPGIGWEALLDFFIPSWPCPVSPPPGRADLSLLLSYHGCLSPPSLFPPSLSPRVCSISFPSGVVFSHGSRPFKRRMCHGSVTWCPITSHLSTLLCLVGCVPCSAAAAHEIEISIGSSSYRVMDLGQRSSKHRSYPRFPCCTCTAFVS